jgi:hypothetical protein
MAKRRVSFKLEPGECDSLKGFAKERRLTLSAASRELIRQGLGMGGQQHEARHHLAIIEKRCRRAQIAAYRAYAGVVELIRFMSKDHRIAGEILELLVEKSNETFRKEEERGDYR